MGCQEVVVGPDAEALLLAAVELGHDPPGALRDMRVGAGLADGTHEGDRHLDGDIERLDEHMLVLREPGRVADEEIGELLVARVHVGSFGVARV